MCENDIPVPTSWSTRVGAGLALPLNSSHPSEGRASPAPTSGGHGPLPRPLHLQRMESPNSTPLPAPADFSSRNLDFRRTWWYSKKRKVLQAEQTGKDAATRRLGIRTLSTRSTRCFLPERHRTTAPRAAPRHMSRFAATSAPILRQKALNRAVGLSNIIAEGTSADITCRGACRAFQGAPSTRRFSGFFRC